MLDADQTKRMGVLGMAGGIMRLGYSDDGKILPICSGAISTEKSIYTMKDVTSRHMMSEESVE
jgi:hypothetical protein